MVDIDSIASANMAFIQVRAGREVSYNIFEFLAIPLRLTRDAAQFTDNDDPYIYCFIIR